MFVKFQPSNSKFCKEVVNCSCPVQHQVACMYQLHSNCQKSLHFQCLELPHGWLPCLKKICNKLLRLSSVNCPSKSPLHPSFGSFFWIILRNSLAKSPQNSLLVICLTTKLKTWFYEEIQGMCILNSLMEFISWTKEGPEFTSNNIKNPCGLTLSLLIYTSMYALKQLLVHSHRFAVVSVQLVLVCSKTIRNWHERWYFTSLSRGIGIQFSTSNNTTSLNDHWLVYRHCAKLTKF